MPFVTVKNLESDKLDQIARPIIDRLVEASGAPAKLFRVFEGGRLVAAGDDTNIVWVEVIMYPRPQDQMQKMAAALTELVMSVSNPDSVHVIFLSISGYEYHYRNGEISRLQ